MRDLLPLKLTPNIRSQLLARHCTHRRIALALCTSSLQHCPPGASVALRSEYYPVRPWPCQQPKPANALQCSEVKDAHGCGWASSLVSLQLYTGYCYTKAHPVGWAIGPMACSRPTHLWQLLLSARCSYVAWETRSNQQTHTSPTSCRAWQAIASADNHGGKLSTSKPAPPTSTCTHSSVH